MKTLKEQVYDDATVIYVNAYAVYSTDTKNIAAAITYNAAYAAYVAAYAAYVAEDKK